MNSFSIDLDLLNIFFSHIFLFSPTGFKRLLLDLSLIFLLPFFSVYYYLLRQSYHVAKADCEFSTASASKVLELQACTTMSNLYLFCNAVVLGDFLNSEFLEELTFFETGFLCMPFRYVCPQRPERGTLFLAADVTEL